MNSKEEIEAALPDTEEELGVYYDEAHGYSKLPDGTMFGHCTSVAKYIRDHILQQGKIMGFQFADNPVASDHIRMCQGHDFLVINDRFLVDLWISLFSGRTDQSVFDLKDPEDQDIIKHYYGDPSKWQVLPEKKRNKKMSENKIENKILEILDEIENPEKHRVRKELNEKVDEIFESFFKTQPEYVLEKAIDEVLDEMKRKN